QFSGARPHLQTLETALVIDFDVDHNDGQHLLVDVDSCDLVRHRPLLGGAESVPHASIRVAGCGRSPEDPTTPNYSVNQTRSGSNSCSASIPPWLISISPLPPMSLWSAVIFMAFRGPQGPGLPVAEIVPDTQPTRSRFR